MNCFKCNEELAQGTDIFFYYKSEKDVFLTIKPELEVFFEEDKKVVIYDESNKKRLKCLKCDFILGKVLPFGPSNKSIKAFACDKVTVYQKSYYGQKWYNIYKIIPIESRDSGDFFRDCIQIQDPMKSSVKKKVIIEPVNFPSVDKHKDFEWITVSVSKNPRDYQVQAFVEGLQKNIVVVLNTGAGKTLVASMILAKMCKLNPSRMGLMLVDRVPLVFQQGDAIAEDTNLSVMGLCGENKTKNRINKLNSEYYDILVVTAGAFFELLEKQYVDVSLFCTVIFDECHHLTGNHRYVEIMKKFLSQTLTHQPRIIGLTASPFAGGSEIEAEENSKNFLKIFPDAKIYSPKLELAHQKTKTELISLSNEQQRFIKVVADKINEYLKEIAKDGHQPNTLLKVDLSNCYQIVGDLRIIQRQYPEMENNKDFRHAFLLMNALDYSVYFGIPSALKYLKDENVSENITEEFRCITDMSERLQKLESYLKDISEDSRILVFVEKRFMARFLTTWIRKRFPDLNPQMVVGHGGFDGMAWEGRQKKNIIKFAKGESRLIVSTSVLEEGIDVVECNLVVAFTGLQSLIRFIQMRGRARKKGSKFVVFETEEERAAKKDAQNQEKIMRKVLEKHHKCHFSEISKHIVQQIKSACKSNKNLRDTSDCAELSIFKADENELAFRLFIDPLKRIDLQKMADDIRVKLQNMDFFTLKRFEPVTENGIFASSEIFTSDIQTFIVLISPDTHSTSSPVLYRRFISSFDYRVSIGDNNFQVWSNSEFRGSEDLTNAQRVPCQKFSLGYFKNRSTVAIAKTFEQESTVLFNSHKSIDIELEDDTKTTIEIRFSSISKFSFMSIDRDDIVLYINLTQVPLFSKTDGTGEIRISQGDKPSSFAKYPLLKLTFSTTDYMNLQRIFHAPNLFPVTLFHTKLQECNDLDDLSGDLVVPWAMRCILDRREVCFPRETREKILKVIEKQCSTRNSKKLTKLCQSILSTLAERKHKFFVNLYQEFRDALSDASKTPLVDDLKTAPENVFMIKRAIMTPTRIISSPETLVPSNRFLEDVGIKAEDVVIVSFRDDDLTKIQSSLFDNRYQDALINFIEIENKKYRYALCTGSQMRSQKAYFVRAEALQEILELRKRIIPDPEQFTSVAKYISRLGIYGTTTTYTGDLPLDNLYHEDDLKAENDELTTDGAGLISLEKAEEIANLMELDETPSAFQIRYSGFKGVVSCTPVNYPELKGKHFVLRKSMKKFENEDRRFCVARYSKYRKVYLNREIINLLTSIKDHDIKNTLFRYMDRDLEELLKMFKSEKIALQHLQEYIPANDLKDIYDSGFSFTENAHWFEVLKGIYRLRSMDIKEKMNIWVEEGALLMGVPDPYGVLNENEVFIQLRESQSSKSKIIQKCAFMYRNPCLHPGDHRLVKCVDNKNLYHLFNVVVLPSFNCKVSLAAECSGGDLDGDHYSVIWDEKLIPPDNFPACNYRDLSLGKQEWGEDVQNPVKIAKFFTDVMTNDALGKIAHMHLALCDIQEKGARDQFAIELAKEQAKAVDYPKTGIKPLIRKEAKDIIATKGYPDFMEKKFEESYQSSKNLGKLYRHCKEITFDFDPEIKDQPNTRDDLELIKINGFQKYLKYARKVYKFYKYHVEMIMSKYQLQSEVDVIVASATYGWDDAIEEDKGKISVIIKDWYEDIKKDCRRLFITNLIEEEEKLRMAYAWYYVAYKEKLAEGQITFLGFPWVVANYISEIRKKKDKIYPSKVKYTIGKSSVLCFKNKYYTTLLSDIHKKFNYVERAEREINDFTKENYQVAKGFLVQPYGSASLYVSEPESDIDICAYATTELYNSGLTQKEGFSELHQDKQQVHFLSLVVSRVVDFLASTKRDFFDSRPPFIKFQSSNEDDPIKCDISMNVNGLKKTYYFHYLFNKDWVYFITFWSLVKWARAAEIIRSVAEGEKGEIDTAEFYALIVHMLNFPKVPEVDISKPISRIKLSKLYKNILISHKQQVSSKKFHEVGQMMLSFFEELSKKHESVTVEWSKTYGLDGVEDVTINANVMNTISLQARRAFHCLSVLRDFNGLINYFMKSEDSKVFTKNLPTAVSFAINRAKDFHSAILEAHTGAKVRIDNIDGRKNFRIMATGTRLQLDKLRKEIHLLIVSNRALVLGRLPQTTSRYFMEGSSKLFSLQDTEDDSRVNFRDSHGECEALHKLRERSSLILKDVEKKSKEESKRQQFEKFKAHIMEQMSSFPSKREDLLKSLEVTVRFGCLYFIDISSSLPSGQRTVSFQELQIALEKGRCKRREYERGDFVSNKEEDEANSGQLEEVTNNPGNRFGRRQRGEEDAMEE